jgi:hypothetical protein
VKEIANPGVLLPDGSWQATLLRFTVSSRHGGQPSALLERVERYGQISLNSYLLSLIEVGQ